MKPNWLQSCRTAGTAASIVLGTAFAAATAQAAEPSPAETVDALNAVFGKHAGARGSHAKGFCASGAFVPSPQARTLSRAKIFAAASVPAELRFSIGGGNPAASDKSRSVRGLAVRLQSGGEVYDLVLISEPVFFAATPASFVSFLQARVADPATKKPDPARIEAHNLRYPEGKLQPSLAGGHAAPFSYATTPYFSNHAFNFVAGNGQGTWARVQLEPAAGTRYLTADEEKTLPADFLQDELKTRVADGPASFDVFAHPAADGDSLTNPAVVWESRTPKILLGRLAVQRLDGQTCDQNVYVPTNLPAGIEASDDPILKIRAAAYAISKGARSQAR